MVEYCNKEHRYSSKTVKKIDIIMLVKGLEFWINGFLMLNYLDML
jgi:hypothetical protein